MRSEGNGERRGGGEKVAESEVTDLFLFTYHVYQLH